jgi:hypothetical protein
VSATTHTREQKKMREQVLERLAVSEPRELLEEAKVELCRATRDLRSCGRVVHHVLSSCGHASLCVECRKRCAYCPICRTSVSSNNSCCSTSSAAAAPDRLRLYELCVEAGLVVQGDGDDAQQSPSSVSPDDVRRRLCSFFDVALDNNLVSLVCHCIQYTVCLLLLLVLKKPSTHSLSPLPFLFFSLLSFLPSCMFFSIGTTPWLPHTFTPHLTTSYQQWWLSGAQHLLAWICIYSLELGLNIMRKKP